MKNFLARSMLVLGALLATACNVGGGSPANPPTDVRVIPGDGGATVTWTMESGVEYWVFSAASSTISPETWATLPQARVVRVATSPQIVSGLTNGTTYSFTVNGRTSGGPGGAGSPSISIIPRLAGQNWTPGSPLASSNLKGLAYVLLISPGQFVTVGAGGTAFASGDAVNWTAVTTGVTADLNAAVYGGGKFVAVGAGGVTVNSADAVTWATGNSGTTSDLYAVTVGGNGLVAVGAGGTILRSGDAGNTWSAETSGTTNNLYGVSFVNSLYIAVGANGTMLTSADGSGWNAIAATSTTQDLKGVTYNLANLLYVAVGAAGTMISSPDLATWTVIAPVTSNSLNSIAAGTQYIAVGDNGTIINSTDGLNWQVASSGTTSNLNAIVFALIGYAAVGVGGVNLTSF